MGDSTVQVPANTKYGRKVQTGSCLAQTGSWVVSQKRSEMDQYLVHLGDTGILPMPNIAKMPKQEVTWPKQEAGWYL